MNSINFTKANYRSFLIWSSAQRKGSPENQQQSFPTKADFPSSPWTDDASNSTPPPVEALFNSNSSGSTKRICFNCEKENCLMHRCPEPWNSKRISANAQKFEKENVERGNNSRLKSKRINLWELQPGVDEWFHIYETVLVESLLSKHNDDVLEENIRNQIRWLLLPVSFKVNRQKH